MDEIDKLSCGVSRGLETGLSHYKVSHGLLHQFVLKDTSKLCKSEAFRISTKHLYISETYLYALGVCRSAMQLQILLAAFNLLVGSQSCIELHRAASKLTPRHQTAATHRALMQVPVYPLDCSQARCLCGFLSMLHECGPGHHCNVSTMRCLSAECSCLHGGLIPRLDCSHLGISPT